MAHPKATFVGRSLVPRHRNPTLLQALGRRVADARTERGITQERLAEMIGIEPVSLSRLETGDRALSLSMLAQIADVLGLGLGQLVGVETALPKPSLRPRETELLREFAALSDAQQDLVLRLVRELAR